MSTVTIKISPPLSNLRLIDVVNAITMVADHPIEYAVEDHAVVFSPKLDEAAPLYAKVFHVAPNTFVENLRSMNRALLAPGKPAGIDGIEMDDRARLSRDGHDDFGGPAASRVRSNYVTKTNDTIQLDQMVRAYFTAAGVNLTDPGKSIYFNDRAGLILARASARELQIIQQAVDDLSQPQPQATVMAKSEPPRPQVVITANYIEADEALLQRLMIDWTESSRETTGIMTKGFATHHAETRPAKEFTGIMTEAQYHSALAAMTLAAANGGYEVDSSSMGKLTNDVGQAACAIWGDDNHVTLDYVSTVGLDGLFSVETTAALTVKTGDHTWQVSASRSLSDGQTLVIGGVMTNQFSKAGKARMVFITPRIIDPAGNPVHTDEELSGKH
jgi:hypothetical protein